MCEDRLEAVRDPDFTGSLPSIVHLDFTREMGLQGPAYEWALWAADEIKNLGGDPYAWPRKVDKTVDNRGAASPMIGP